MTGLKYKETGCGQTQTGKGRRSGKDRLEDHDTNVLHTSVSATACSPRATNERIPVVVGPQRACSSSCTCIHILSPLNHSEEGTPAVDASGVEVKQRMCVSKATRGTGRVDTETSVTDLAASNAEDKPPSRGDTQIILAHRDSAAGLAPNQAAPLPQTPPRPDY
eukprot:scaffold17575_cov117-Isochrysis_galbana.AAC.2